MPYYLRNTKSGKTFWRKEIVKKTGCIKAGRTAELPLWSLADEDGQEGNCSRALKPTSVPASRANRVMTKMTLKVNMLVQKKKEKTLSGSLFAHSKYTSLFYFHLKYTFSLWLYFYPSGVSFSSFCQSLHFPRTRTVSKWNCKLF